MDGSSYSAAERRFRDMGAEIFADREREQEYDWTLFYNSPCLKLRWDVAGKTASEVERIAGEMAAIFGRKPQYRR